MEEKTIKKVLALVVIAIVVLSVFVGIIFKKEVLEETEEPELYAEIKVDTNIGIAPFAIDFKSFVIYNKGETNYQWDFGDGASSQEKSPNHVYEVNGSYNCSLIVTDDSGGKITNYIEILAKKNKAPDIGISINSNTIDRVFIPILPKIIAYAGTQQQIVNALLARNPLLLGEGQIECFAQVDDPEDDEIASYEWTVAPDDGLTRGGKIIEAEYNFNGSHIKIPDLYTWREGRYVIVLTVTDSAGNEANTSLEFQVDKSGTELMRAQKLRLITNGLNTWNIYLNSILGATIAGIILKLVKNDEFTGVKLVVLLISKFILNLEDIDINDIYNQINKYLEQHPKIKESFQESLEKLQNKLEDLKEKYPDRAETIDGIIESIEVILEAIGFKNKRPIVFEPYPKNNFENVDLNQSSVYITVEDYEGDAFNLKIHGEHISDVILSGVTNKTFKAPLITPLPKSSEIIWYVNASTTDGAKWTNSTYRFTTHYD